MATTTDYFSIEDQGDVRVIRLRAQENILFGDIQAMQQLFDMLQELHQRRQKVVLLETPADAFSPSVLNRFWESVLNEQPVRGSRREPPRRPTMEFFHTAIERYLPLLQNLNTIMVSAFQGNVDLDLFGTFLATDYRICGDDTVLVNHVLERGTPPGSALFWWLSRYVGYGKAQEILIGGKSLTAGEAQELGLVNRVVESDSLASESAAMAAELAAKPAEALASLKRAFQYADRDLGTYLKHSAGWL